jgi:hypothetical protein
MRTLVTIVLALAVVACASFPALAQCAIVPFGLIGERWNALDGAAGPMGCPISAEFRVPGPKALPGETTTTTPVLASHNGRLFLAFKGAGNSAINVMYSEDGGLSFHGKFILAETTDIAPALASHNGRLFLAWKGSGNENINVAKVVLIGNTAGGFGIGGLEDKIVLGESTNASPALASHQGRLFLAWKGADNDQLNLAFSDNNGLGFTGKRVLGDASDRAPSLFSAGNRLLLAWKGSGNSNINVAGVTLFGNTAGGFGIEGLNGKVTLGELTDLSPSVGSHLGKVFVAWRGRGNPSLNLIFSADGGATFGNKRIFGETSDSSPSLATHADRLFLTWKGEGNERLNVARVTLFGNTAGGFGIEGLEGIDSIKQTYQNGEIAWSPAQGARMVVAAYQHDDNLIVSWGDTGPTTYEKFIVRWDRNGANAGQADVDSYVGPTDGFYRISQPAPGLYSVLVEGCDTPDPGPDCPYGFTTPVNVTYNLPPLPPFERCDPQFQPFGLIGERWARLGGAEGSLGCPLQREHPVPGRNGAAQRFEHGEISWSPDQGELLTLAVYQKDRSVVAEWGPTNPFNYEKFIVRLDRDGQNIGQQDIGEGTAGSWSTPVDADGSYTVFVEGCDEDLLGDTECPQSFAIPATVFIDLDPAPAPGSTPPPPDEPCAIEPVGLILERWLAMGGKRGIMGCPTAAEHAVPGRNGRAMPFENGEMVWTPDQGPSTVLAVFQEGNGVKASWGSTAPNAHLFFIVRVDYEGVNVGQIDVAGNTGAEYVVAATRLEDEPETPTVGNGTGLYSLYFKGCDDGGLFEGADCEDTWSIPASVFFRTAGTPELDFSDLPVPRTVHDALALKPERARRVAEYMARFADLGGDWGDGQTTNALAMLYVIDGDVANGLPATSRRRFGQRFSMLTEINNAVRSQIIYARSGTTSGAPCPRTGEYDTALKGYVTILYRYGKYLAPDVRYRILRLLNKTGGHDPEDSNFGCLGVIIPETENHLWMIDSSRYLTNQLWARQSSDPRFDNRANGLADLLTGKLREHLSFDFLEYNSRPYARYTWSAIQNLYDFAEDERVKTAAQIVLDYLSAKVAVSSSDGRRQPPYRRRVSHNHADLFNPQSDRTKKRFLLYTAPTAVMDELHQPNRIEWFATSEMMLAAATSYQPPNLILDLMVNSSHRNYYQQLRYATSETYAATPDFLISAGGVPSDYAYVVLGTGKDEDLGVVHPTALIPTGQFTTIEQMIRFGGIPDEVGVGTAMCVAPGFACGMRPTIPPLYTSDPRCVRRSGSWTFIDFASDQCRPEGNREFGFFAAVFGAGSEFGLLEAVPKAKLGGMSLRRFADDTLARNRNRTFSAAGDNRYRNFEGNDIRFNLGSTSPIASTGVAAIDAAIGGPFRIATGTVMNTLGVQGSAMTVTNAATGDVLTLDLTDPANPVRTLVEADPLNRLLAVGVDFSVAEAELRDWLTNPFTPYPALSEAMLEVLGERGLRRLVHIDVVAFKYEDELGGGFPATAGEVNRDTLRAAILASHNERYDERVPSFELLLR